MADTPTTGSAERYRTILDTLAALIEDAVEWVPGAPTAQDIVADLADHIGARQAAVR